MAQILKNLLGNNPKDRDVAEEMRTILAEMREERERFEKLIQGSQDATGRLEALAAPISQVESQVGSALSRVEETETRLAALADVEARIAALADRSSTVAAWQEEAASQFATVREDAEHIRSTFDALREKVDLATDLEKNLDSFLEVEKPFRVLQGEAEAIRGQMDSTTEQLSRLREQHDRLMDAHKLAQSKMEAMDRRRDELGRDLQDKERRIVSVENTVRELDGVRNSIADLKRSMGSVRALADSVAQKTVVLEAQRDAVDRALAQAESLERAMQKIDAGVRQQEENEKKLLTLHDEINALDSLHEEVMDRSSDVTDLQRHTLEQTGVIRDSLAASRSELQSAVERFEFEARGLESVSQRVADLRGSLSEFENRYRELSDSSRTVKELLAQTESLVPQVSQLGSEVARIDAEASKLDAIARGLDEASRTAESLASQVTRVESARESLDAMQKDLASLAGSHALVRDAVEQTKVAHAELGRTLERQGETRDWLAGVERSLGDLRSQVSAVNEMGPQLHATQDLARRITESIASIDAQKSLVDDVHHRLTEAGTLGSSIDERGRELLARMAQAEERFTLLSSEAEEAERLAKAIAEVKAGVVSSTRQIEGLAKNLASIEKRCVSVEGLAGKTETLRSELEQRHASLEEAKSKLDRASKVRQEASTAADQLQGIANGLVETLAAAEKRVTELAVQASDLESRSSELGQVDRRLGQFESRIGRWEHVDQEVTRTLELISSRQGTVQALKTELERMFAMAESTVENVRAITSAHAELADSRTTLNDVLHGLNEVKEIASGLEEREHQMTRAEDRLSRAEALLGDVRGGLESLQGQKALVDQAIEKTSSLRFLLKQADAMIDNLRDERKMTAGVQDAITLVGPAEDEDDGEAAAA